jgi:2-amino-4-hydroxy-6-hydroxymethyldihydropteridine diphosphokinase
MNSPYDQLNHARTYIRSRIGSIVQCSDIYQTAAWGFTDQDDFLNQVLIVTTSLSPQECMQLILEVEQAMGRVRTIRNAPRIIDIDILLYDSLVIREEGLTIPHPLMQERRFVLQPLADLLPGYIHPVFHTSIARLLATCSDKGIVKKIMD